MKEKSLGHILLYLHLGDPDALTGDDCRKLYEHISATHAAISAALELGYIKNRYAQDLMETCDQKWKDARKELTPIKRITEP